MPKNAIYLNAGKVENKSRSRFGIGTVLKSNFSFLHYGPRLIHPASFMKIGPQLFE